MLALLYLIGYVFIEYGWVLWTVITSIIVIGVAGVMVRGSIAKRILDNLLIKLK